MDTSSDFVALRSNVSLAPGATVEFLTFEGKVVPTKIDSFYDCAGSKLERTKSGGVFCIPKDDSLATLTPFTVARERCNAV